MNKVVKRILIIALVVVVAVVMIFLISENAWKAKFDVRFVDYDIGESYGFGDGAYIWEIENKSNKTASNVYAVVAVEGILGDCEFEVYVGQIHQREVVEFQLSDNLLESKMKEKGKEADWRTRVDIVGFEWD